MAPTTDSSRFSLPFWVVTQRKGALALPVMPSDAPGYAAAFSTAHLAATYMVKRGETSFEFTLVSRATLRGWADNLRQMGGKGICLDPAPDRCGDSIDLDEIDAKLS